ncbi:MAG TPA: 16S rRNA (cytidine(1402)-2'-O)-methyltransferase [Microthrixaceae bacterium]|nr:16S rRNA (cytidine(1402)-2'-O)-methyltransferase [Microthrixaceae bacterium]
MTGTLFVVATPIGNLGDLSARTAQVLAQVAVLACEDTRRTSKLLTHLGLPRPEMVVVNEHTEAGAVRRLLDRLDAGDDVALVSDAGTPAISDPGHLLVNAAIDAGCRVEAIPGPSAVVVALVLSGLATDRFCFEGFLPRKGGPRRARIAELVDEVRTSVVFESPRRVAATVAELRDALGATRRVVIARELTKLHEEVWRGTLDTAADMLGHSPTRGEYVLVIDGARHEEEAVDDDRLLDALRAELLEGATRRDAIEVVARVHGVPRNRVYELALTIPTS